MASFPVTDDLDALAAAMNEYAQTTDEYGGHTITVRPEDVTLASGGSLTDAGGNVFTLRPMTGVFADSPLADVYENGTLLESGQFVGGGFWDAIRLVDGVVLGENGKGLGWFGPDRAGADDPGPGDNAGALPVVTPEPPVVTPPPVDTTENPPVTPPGDVVSPPSDVVHAFFHHAHHHQEHRMNFVREATADTTAPGDVSASANVGSVNPAVIAALGASAVADITAAGATDTSTDANVPAAGGNDDSVSHRAHHGLTVDQSIKSSSQLSAHHSHHQAEAATG